MPLAYFRNAPLGVRLLAIALVAVLPVAILSLFNLVQSAKHQRAVLERSAMEALRALSTAVDNEMNASIAALEILATAPSLAAGNLGDFYEEARGALSRRPSWENITVIDASGMQVLNLRRPFGAALPRTSDQDGVDMVVRSRTPVVSGMIVAPLLKESRTVVRVPVFREGQVVVSPHRQCPA